MRIVNLTPHVINIVTAEGLPVMDILPSGEVARVRSYTIEVGELEAETDMAGIDVKIPLTSTEYEAVEGLPSPRLGTVYVVSSLVAQRVKGRDDVLIPNESVRDENGRIVGCRSLGRV